MDGLQKGRRQIGRRPVPGHGARQISSHGTRAFEAKRQDQQAHEGRTKNPNGDETRHGIDLWVKEKAMFGEA